MPITDLTKKDLEDYENDIAELYHTGSIKAPIHLRSGDEDYLIKIFEQIHPQDWVTGQWAMHEQCLLKGVRKEDLTKAILNKKSITLCFKEQKIISSAIVASICPISVGLALAAKRKGLNEMVYCFIGDTTFMNGISQECIRYSQNHKLPIKFIIGDNGVSVKTPTAEVWNLRDGELESLCKQYSNTIYYKYKNTWPHSGTGKRVNLW